MSAERLGDLGEIEIVARILRGLGAGVGLSVAPGDDAAVLAPLEGALVVTVDRQREGSHFQRHWLAPEDLAHRALAAAASDIGAMGARPCWSVCALELPAELSVAWLDRLVVGLREAGKELGCPVIGGDSGSAEAIALFTTVGGVVPPGSEPVRRSGAGAGDGCWIAGGLGHAAAGRLFLERDLASGEPTTATCVAAYQRPRPPLRLGLDVAAAAVAHAMMDVSDGLAMDLTRLCRASRCGVRLDAGALVDATLSQAAASLAVEAVDLALSGGDDYALLVAVPPDREECFVRCAREVEVPARRIGEFVDEADGLSWGDGRGVRPLPAAGWDPFAGARP